MSDRNGLLAGPGIMLLSAAIFGFFGFMTPFPELDANTGELIPLVLTLKWTLRITAVALLAAGLVAMAQPLVGDIVYSVTGLVSAIMLVVVGVWDLLVEYHSGVHWFLLFAFAAWNGWGSYSGLQSITRVRRDGDEV